MPARRFFRLSCHVVDRWWIVFACGGRDSDRDRDMLFGERDRSLVQ